MEHNTSSDTDNRFSQAIRVPFSSSITAIINQKGGVGKTTTAVNLATALAALNKRVLLIDLDPQGNASTGLGVSLKERNLSSYTLLHEAVKSPQTIHATLVPDLDLIPATPDLAACEFEFSTKPERAYLLQQALVYIKSTYHYIFLDCPPSLGLLTLNALVAAHKVLVPLQCEFYALEGLSHLLQTVQRIQKTMNPNLFFEGIVLTMYQKRSMLNQQVAADAQAHLGNQVYNTLIPRNVRVSEAPSFGKPVLLHDLDCAGSKAYVELAREFIEREHALTLSPSSQDIAV